MPSAMAGAPPGLHRSMRLHRCPRLVKTKRSTSEPRPPELRGVDSGAGHPCVPEAGEDEEVEEGAAAAGTRDVESAPEHPHVPGAGVDEEVEERAATAELQGVESGSEHPRVPEAGEDEEAEEGAATARTPGRRERAGAFSRA